MTVITLRSGTAAEWTASNPLLATAEAGFEEDTGKLKFGDGVTQWSSLGYFSPNTHNHDASAITTGEFNSSRIPLATGSNRGAISPGDYLKLGNIEHRQVSTPLPTAAPSTFALGMSYFELSGETGWPFAFGVVETMRVDSVNPRGYQRLTRKDPGAVAGEQWIRMVYDGDTWTQWNQIVADNAPRNMTYINSWTDFNNTVYARLKATQVTKNVVSIAGMPKGGTLQDGIGIATVPTEFRPNRDVYASCTVRNSTGTINAAGMAVIRRSGSANPGELQIFGITSTTTYVCLGFTYNVDAD